MDRENKIPIICAVNSTADIAHIFNPNAWLGASKGIVQSCLSEMSVLHHCVNRLTELCNNPRQSCQTHIENIQRQWLIANFSLDKTVIYGEVPDLHIRIEAFYAGIKTCLDLLVQLLSSEKVVNTAIDGFHKSKGIPGGKPLNTLKNNVMKDKIYIAEQITALILEEKELWIDQVINARDQLIHPDKFAMQIMFHLEFEERPDGIHCTSINPPMTDSGPIHEYANRVLDNLQKFSSRFFAMLKSA